MVASASIFCIKLEVLLIHIHTFSLRCLIARDTSKSPSAPAAFVSFRFDMDYDDEVLYVYEVQMEKDFRRKGLGKFMMQVG